jgi:excinuclease ABC subunit B
MREAAGNLEFEEAARIRDEIKRLQATELAIADDPFARQSAVEDAVDTAMRPASPTDPAAARSTKGVPGTRAIRGKKPQPRRAR